MALIQVQEGYPISYSTVLETLLWSWLVPGKARDWILISVISVRVWHWSQYGYGTSLSTISTISTSAIIRPDSKPLVPYRAISAIISAIMALMA